MQERKYSLSVRAQNWMMGVLERFAPVRALRAEAAQMALSYYRAAQRKRTNYDSVTNGYTSKEELQNDLPTMRARSRDLYKNNPYYRGIIGTLVDNIVGNGIQPQSRLDADALGISREKASDYEKQIEAVFDEWREHCDNRGHLGFADYQRMLVTQWKVNGEAININHAATIRAVPEYGEPILLGLEPIEADRLANPADKSRDDSFFEGVEIDSKRGTPIRYYFLKQITGSGRYNSAEFYKVSVKDVKTGYPNILHLFEQSRPDQLRGVPAMAAALDLFQQLDEYQEAILVNERVRACFSVFVKTMGDPLTMARGISVGTDANDMKIQELAPGLINYMKPGEEIQIVNPQAPGASYDAFVKSILQAIGASIGMNYNLVAKDWSSSNFSNTRVGMLEFQKAMIPQQQLFIRRFLQPVWERLIYEAVAAGRLNLPNFEQLRYFWTHAFWVTPGWRYIEPYKEINAAEKAIKMGLSSYAQECGKQGVDWEETFEQWAREREKAKELGIESIYQPGGDNSGERDDREDEDDE